MSTNQRHRLRLSLVPGLLALLIGLLIGSASLAQPEQDLPLMNDAVSDVRQLAQGGATFITSFDATPDPDAEVVYFTAVTWRGSTGAAAGNGSVQDGSGVFKVAAAGGEVEALAIGRLGQPWFLALGITISTDGRTLFVSDPETGIFTLPTTGGTPTLLAGTEGTAPWVPQIVREADQDMLYYTAWLDGSPGIVKLPAEGGAPPIVIVKGAPLVYPSGVAVTREGTVFVADHGAGEGGSGAVLRIENGQVDILLEGFRPGVLLAGAALSLDESVLLVSVLHPDEGTGQVLLINLVTNEVGVVNEGIKVEAGAGGVHRAHNRDHFAWGASSPDADLDIFIATTSEVSGMLAPNPFAQPQQSQSTPMNPEDEEEGSIYLITTPSDR